MLRAAFIILVLYVILSAAKYPTKLFPYCHRERQRGDPRE